MTPINELPSLNWSTTASEQLQITGPEIVEQSHVAYQIGNIAVAGLIYGSLLCPPWFWFALADGITLRELLDFRRLMEKIPTGSLTAVNASHKEAIKFARVFGFEETDSEAEISGAIYKLFRRK